MAPKKVIANFGVSQFIKFRVALCHGFAPGFCFASCNCCHDPFIVRSARINRFTIYSANVQKFAKCDFATTFGTNKSLHIGMSKNVNVRCSEQRKYKLAFEKFPTPSTVNFWQLNLKTKVCPGSCLPTDAMSWIREIEAAQNIDDLRTSHSIPAKQYPNFETLNTKIS